MTAAPRRVLGAFLLLLLAACGREPEPPEAERLVLTPVGFAALPGWQGDALAEAVPTLLRSCDALARLPDGKPLGADPRTGDGAAWRAACAAAAALPPDDEGAARAFLESAFVPYRAADGTRETGLFTGYFEPELRGARRRGGAFTVPLYRRPPDLVGVDLGEFRESLKGERLAGRVVDGRLRPYPDRAAIEAGALAGRGLELLWVDDPVDAFFLHIQGSGRVRLPDGGLVRVGYAAQNGHPYHAIGRSLIERGAIAREDMSMQAIRAWIAAHPEEGRALMAANPSYVFFRELDGDGPLGAQGAALTPRRSLAVDPRFVPLGVPVWLDAEHPAGGGARLQRLVVAQDTGGAIRGPVRGDLFWGAGGEAAEMAGRMRSQGRYYLLLPRPAAGERGG